MEHICLTCKFKKRKIADITVSVEDNEVFERIQNMVSTAEQACLPTSIPEDTSPKMAAAYFQGATANLGEVRLLLTDWWKDIQTKFDIPGSAKYDNTTRTFYECVDSDGNPSINGDWVEKK